MKNHILLLVYTVLVCLPLVAAVAALIQVDADRGQNERAAERDRQASYTSEERMNLNNNNQDDEAESSDDGLPEPEIQ